MVPAPAALPLPLSRTIGDAARALLETGECVLLIDAHHPPHDFPLMLRGKAMRRRAALAVLGLAFPDLAADLAIGESKTGQPIIMPETSELHVSFARREPWSVIGLACRRIGVDIEGRIAAADIPFNLLRAEEQEMLGKLSPGAQATAFLQLWTLKEAALKALGTGLKVPPEALRIGYAPAVTMIETLSSNGTWHEQPVSAGFCAVTLTSGPRSGDEANYGIASLTLG